MIKANRKLTIFIKIFNFGQYAVMRLFVTPVFTKRRLMLSLFMQFNVRLLFCDIPHEMLLKQSSQSCLTMPFRCEGFKLP